MKPSKRLRYVDYAARMQALLDLVADEQQCIELEYKGKLIRLEFVGEAPEMPHDPEAVRRALKASAGALKGIDIEELKRDLREMGYQDTPNHRWP
jgi:hypothetical protein